MFAAPRATWGLMLTLVLLITVASAQAYEFLLDIDIDDDPSTINDLTWDTETVVRMILAPTEPNELFNGADFGLGGSCLECQQVQEYGTMHDLLGDDWTADWTEVDELYGSGDGALHLGCFDDPGFHIVLHVEPLIDYFVLTEPIFIATFNVWVADPVPPGCQQPPSNLATMFEQGENGYWNYVQIGGPAVEASNHSWSTLKATYR